MYFFNLIISKTWKKNTFTFKTNFFLKFYLEQFFHYESICGNITLFDKQMIYTVPHNCIKTKKYAITYICKKQIHIF